MDDFTCGHSQKLEQPGVILQVAKGNTVPNLATLRKLHTVSGQNKNRHHQSDLSLSTIAEESGSYASNTYHSQAEPTNNVFPMTTQSLNGASIKLEPNFTVETTTYPSNQVSFTTYFYGI